MTSIIKVQNIQYTDGDAALTIADGGGVTLPSALSAKGGAVFNEDSADVDFRVESNGNANMIFVDGGNDSVGIGISNPASYCQHADELVVGGTDGNSGITIVGGDDDYSIIDFNRASNTSDTPNGAIEYNHTDNAMYIKANALSAIQIDNAGRVKKPYQPIYSGIRGADRMNTSQGFTMTNVNLIPMSNILNQGSHFASNTFTAPVAGNYFCSVYGLAKSATSTWIALYITQNSTTKGGAYFDVGNSWTNLGANLILPLSASDTIKFQVECGHADGQLHEGQWGGCSVQLVG